MFEDDNLIIKAVLCFAAFYFLVHIAMYLTS